MGAEKRRELSSPSQVVRPALALVRERGGDVPELIRRHGLPDDADTEREISTPSSALPFCASAKATRKSIWVMALG